MYRTCNESQYLHSFYYFKELHHCFIFLPDETESQSIITNLGLLWSLSFISGKNTVATLLLNEQKLVLNKHEVTRVTSYPNIFYIIQTSGSTGVSKFVRVTHQSIESNVKHLSKIFKIQPCNTIYFGTPLTFDPSMIELLLALENGACLLITPSKNQINPVRLHQTLIHPENGATFLQIVPSLFLRWSEIQIEDILLNSKLKILAFGGEPFPRALLKFKKSNFLRIFNLYGVTEVSCWATVCEVAESLGEVPLGDELDETIVEVRDDSGRLVESGEGEIFIGSSTRICYVDDEKIHHKTPVFRATGDLAFICDKKVYYKGRQNDVFKRLGHKIQLCKIETIVLEQTGIQNVCVWSKTRTKLLLFLIIESFDNNTKNKVLDKVRIKLLHTLSKQCFPDFIDIIRKCPITSHGKIDKNTLESIYLNRNQADKRQVVDIFKTLVYKYFGLRNFGESTFFELGGNSILAVQFLSEFEDESGSACPDLVSHLFESDLNTCVEILRDSKTVQKRPQTEPTPKSEKKVKSGNIGIELKIAWSYNLEACVDSTSLIFTHKERKLVAVGSFSHIFAILDSQSGHEIAKFVLPDVVESTPCYHKNYLYVTCFDGNLYCLDFALNSIKWAYKTNDRVKCTPILCYNATRVVFGSYDKHIHCVDILKGSGVWTSFVSESVISTPLLLNQKIYVATICGTCLCLSETSGTILWQYKTGSPIFGAPCTHNGCILWPNVTGSVVCVTSNGHKLWQYDTGGHLYSSLTLQDGFLLFGSHDRCLYVLKIENGSPEPHFVANLDDCITTPLILADFIIVAGNSGRLFVVTFKGELGAELRLPGEIFSSVVGCDRRLFVGCRDNNLYCIEIKNI
ncbi:beta-alanine-activating enzyme isoform X2 [Tribolium madens]|uniref:beta-alanine-activating enzyme isoform X2 n=1 Tax=Tribolium madens TaxID=41895 RepID=UPI001CF74DB7|nr:beta-alanine-activating enzyme isoform X2 [Tribolium madens]